jgi:hypothetical protein
VGLAGAGAWWFRKPLAECWQQAKGGAERIVRTRFQPNPKRYATLSRELERRRVELAARHRDAPNDAERAAVERAARAVLEDSLPAMMHCWLGTPYDFNGSASRPGSGKIACGYFVSTVLKDAGFGVDRFQLGQQPSGNILRTFLPEKSCLLTIGEDYQKFASALAKREPGVYIVGLDTHVAFVVVDNNDFRFIHATGRSPRCVVDQDRAKARTLQRSRWRMLGNLTADRGVIRRWLKAEKIAVRAT